MRPGPRGRTGVAGRTRLRVLAVALACAAATAGAGRAAAAGPRVHGLLDLVASGRTETDDLNVLYRGVSPFDAYQFRLFVDGAVTDRIQVFTQVLFTEAVAARPIGAYAMADPWEGRDLHVVAGLIPWLIGTFEPQSYSDRNPLVGYPMMYQHHTTLRWDQLPAGVDALLSKAGSGHEGVSHVQGSRAFAGMPVVYSDWWDFGVGLTGSARPMEFSLGYVNGTPGWPDPTRDENGGKSLLGRIGVVPAAGARLGVSGSWGPYLTSDLDGILPPGRRAEDYAQTLVMADAEWSMGHVALRAEGYRNTWETPALGDLRVKGLYVEGKVTLPAGFYVAGRYDVIRFNRLTDSTGVARAWDREWDRGEAGVGYRIARGVVAKAVYQWNVPRAARPGDESSRLELAAGQLSIRF